MEGLLLLIVYVHWAYSSAVSYAQVDRYIRTDPTYVLCPPACTLDTFSVQLGRLAVHPEVFRANVLMFTYVRTCTVQG